MAKKTSKKTAKLQSRETENSDEQFTEIEDLQMSEKEIEDNNDESDDDDSEISENADDAADVAALFKGPEIDDDGSDDDSGSGSVDDENHQKANEVAARMRSSGSEQCTFDMRNMLAVNSHQIPPGQLYKSAQSDQDENIAIKLDSGHGLSLDEGFLCNLAAKGCAQLVQALWQLPTAISDAGPLVSLPTYDEIRLPRALPPPPPKVETKWEKFAKAKGIPLNREKRSRKVWDEATDTWMFRHGYQKANGGAKEWPIMEVGTNDDPYDDPWEKIRDAKHKRIDKNTENRMKNQERVGNLAKGTTNRAVKSKEKGRKAGKEGGNNDRVNVPPTGVPVDMNRGAKRGKGSTSAALEAVQRSTASMGKFDKVREGEPERKKALSKAKKRKYESGTDKKVVNSEGEKSMKILNAVMNGGGVAKEKAIRKGKLATGETPYDYDYNDGLGPSSFKKKKGRAGAGKMKKMTKKRAQ